MTRVFRLLGSLTIAVILLIAIAGVLAWGTIYETRFGTAAVQRFVYHAWWFQTLLGFLAVNLAVAATQRFPWKRHQAPFLLAHLGIILILVGGIIGGRFGVEGQMMIPEGQAENALEMPGNVLVVSQEPPGIQQVIPTRFDTQAWMHEPNTVFPVFLKGRAVQLTVDRYYPDAVMSEEITDRGTQENPAVHLRLAHQEQQDEMWLFARDPERFGVGWGEAHVLFLESKTEAQLSQLLGRSGPSAPPRGVISLKLPGMNRPRDIPVPEDLRQGIAIEGTPYWLAFRDYFPDFAITEHGPGSRSSEPNNPAVSFTLTGPEGTDAYLLFALHPDFQAIHGLEHTIPAQVAYTHSTAPALPPNAIGLVLAPAGRLIAVLTGEGSERQVIDPVAVGTAYTHPSLGYQFELVGYVPRTGIEQHISNRGNEVKAEALHLIGREGKESAEAWLTLRQAATLPLGSAPIVVEFRPPRRELPFTIKLLDFRKIEYPGIQMAAGFEADVELTDPQRGIILMRKISMNNPLRYRGFSFFQSSYIEGPTETTVLSVRNDPGTPFVYAGFIIVILGVVSMFVIKPGTPSPATRQGAAT